MFFTIFLPVKKLAKDVDLIIGAKDSSGDWDNLKAYITETRELDKKFYVLSGNDSLILPALKEGGVGGIAGCSNVYPHVLSSIYNLFKEGKLEEAEAAQDSIASFRAVFKYGNPNTVVKKAVAMLGYPVGDCRRPFNYLCDEGVPDDRKRHTGTLVGIYANNGGCGSRIPADFDYFEYED